MATDDQSDPTRGGSRSGDDEPTTKLPPSGGTDPSAADETPTAEQPAAADQPPRAEQPYAAADESAPAPRRSWRDRRLGVPVAIAVAAGLVVASGLGGFALGALTTGDDLTPVGSFGRGGDDRFPGFPGDRDGDGDGHWRGFPDGPGQGPLPPDLDGDQTPPDLDDEGTDEDTADLSAAEVATAT